MAYFSSSSPPSLSDLLLEDQDHGYSDFFGLSTTEKGKERVRMDSGVEVDHQPPSIGGDDKLDHGDIETWSEEEDTPTDPALYFPVELFLLVLSFLSTPGELYPCFLVSHSWKTAAEDQTLWTALTTTLWSDKDYIPQKFREMLGKDAKKAYKQSLKDSKRNIITKEELCAFEWQWRFKADAGEHFTEEDPWYLGFPPRVRIFHEDGSMGGTFARPDVTWRFVTTAEGRKDKLGRFVRVGPYPASVFSRHSKWGWVMESAWTLATAFPLPLQNSDPELEDRNRKVTTDTQRYEVLAYNSGLDYPDDMVLNRRGFEKLSMRVGWNIRLLRRRWDESEDEDGSESEEDEDEEPDDNGEGSSTGELFNWV